MLECFGVFSEKAEFARPMSRGQATNRRDLLLPSLGPDWHQTSVIFNSSAGLAPPPLVKGRAEEAPRCWTRQNIHYGAAKQAVLGAELTGPELIGANHLLARLVFQQIRRRSRSGGTGGQSCSSDEPQRRGVPASAPALRSPRIGRAALPSDAPVSVPVPLTVETLFTQLARRRLRGRAEKETRS
jgi:hypothetical protein